MSALKIAEIAIEAAKMEGRGVWVERNGVSVFVTSTSKAEDVKKELLAPRPYYDFMTGLRAE